MAVTYLSFTYALTTIMSDATPPVPVGKVWIVLDVQLTNIDGVNAADATVQRLLASAAVSKYVHNLTIAKGDARPAITGKKVMASANGDIAAEIAVVEMDQS